MFTTVPTHSPSSPSLLLLLIIVTRYPLYPPNLSFLFPLPFLISSTDPDPDDRGDEREERDERGDERVSVISLLAEIGLEADTVWG